MPTFVRIVSFETKGGSFDDKKDSKAMGSVLAAIQSRGGVVKSISHRAVYHHRKEITIALYLVVYDAPDYIDV
jgi:hypothetical protein